MKYAYDREQIRIAASPGARGICPICRESVRPRCGEVVSWHWAHEARLDCDPWQEPETDWHRNWKSLAPPERVEVVIGDHRADLISPDGVVIELQHSSISPEEIKEREAFYKRMIWLLDGSTFADSFRVIQDQNPPTFTWSPPRPSWFAATAPIFVHAFSFGRHIKTIRPGRSRPSTVWSPVGTSERIFQIKSLERGQTASGTGRIIELDRFASRMIVPLPLTEAP